MGLREKLIALLRSNHTLLETAAVSATSLLRLADLLIEHGVTIPVRCRDCKNYEAGYVRRDHGWCKEWGTAVRASGFCHHGERRTDG